MKALVIDDEELARKRVVNLLEEVPEIEMMGECSNGKTAIKQINTLKPDLLFLDINMKDMNGFEVLQKIELSPKPAVIFVTAYDHYASRAFEVDAFDFLLKPFKDERFFRAMGKMLKTSRSEADILFEKRFSDLFRIYSEERSKEKPVRIAVKQGNKTILLSSFEIFYILASGSYAEIYTGSQKYVIRDTLNSLAETLDPDQFCRIHRSTIVNIHHVKEIVHSDFSEIDARMSDDKVLHISKNNKKQFLEKIGI